MSTNKQRESSLVHIPSEDRKKTMETHHKDHRNPLLILAGRGLKYFLLILAGFAIAFVFSHALGAVSLAKSLLSFDVWVWFARGAVALFCLFAIAMIFESWR